MTNRLLMYVTIVAMTATSGKMVLAQQNVSKSGTAAGTFLEIPVGAAAISLGSAYVSLANDVTAIYWNPAGIASMQQSQALVSHTNWIADTKHDYAALAVPLQGFGTIGISFTALNMNDMKVTTVDQPEGTGEYFSAGNIAIGLTYAKQLSDRFYIGFTGKYIQETIWHESASAAALDVGTVFRTDLFGGLTFGASLSNFGTPMRLSGRDTRFFTTVDPTKQGSNHQIPMAIEMDSWDLPLLFQFGISSTPLKSDTYRWTVAADALHPSDNFESVNVGTEFAYQEFLFLRAGFRGLFLAEREGGLSLGVGLNSRMLFEAVNLINVEYAYRDMGRLEGVHVFSIGVRF